MKHLELHIIQSVPVACLNRDDLNSPKTAIFWRRSEGKSIKSVVETCNKGVCKRNNP